jgi:hypothetical protein
MVTPMVERSDARRRVTVSTHGLAPTANAMGRGSYTDLAGQERVPKCGASFFTMTTEFTRRKTDHPLTVTS